MIPPLMPTEPPPYVMSDGYRIYTRLTCPRCLRPVLNICMNCSSQEILVSEDPFAFDPLPPEPWLGLIERAPEPAWLYVCSVCHYVGYGQYCGACLCFLPMRLFVEPPPPNWLWVVLAISLVLGWILIHHK